MCIIFSLKKRMFVIFFGIGLYFNLFTKTEIIVGCRFINVTTCLSSFMYK